MSLKIKINIANRVYPMTINRDAEENIRKSVKKIEERLKFYEKNYAIKDQQDLLAMCLIEIASKLESVTLNLSLIIFAHTLRAALNLAISSKK